MTKTNEDAMSDNQNQHRKLQIFRTLPKEKKIYLTHSKSYRTFPDSFNLVHLLPTIIKYPIQLLQDEDELPGTLFVGTKRYAASDATAILHLILHIGCEYRNQLHFFNQSDDEDGESNSFMDQSLIEKKCKSLSLDKNDVIEYFKFFDAL